MKRIFIFFACFACAGSLSAQNAVTIIPHPGATSNPTVYPDAGATEATLQSILAKTGTGGGSSSSGTPDVALASQSLSMTTVGNAVTFTVPTTGVGTLETLIQGLTASGGTVGFKASAVAGGPYSTFAAQGGSPLGDYTSLSADGSWTINTAGHVQIQLVVLTAGTGSVTVAGNYSATIRHINARVVSPAAGASGTVVNVIAPVTATANGTLAAGSRGPVFAFSSNFSGTIQGGATLSGASTAYYAPPVPAGTTLGAITYTVSAGSITIFDVR